MVVKEADHQAKDKLDQVKDKVNLLEVKEKANLKVDKVTTDSITKVIKEVKAEETRMKKMTIKTTINKQEEGQDLKVKVAVATQDLKADKVAPDSSKTMTKMIRI